jgi:CrcB protein
MTPKLLLAVALGGAIGSAGRYAAMSLVGRLTGPGFPWGTLTVNIVGSFAMGALVEAAALRWSLSEPLRALVFVGLLGGFTTFSTFSLDLVTLVERQQGGLALLYGGGSVVIGLFALVAGLYAVRWGLA